MKKPQTTQKPAEVKISPVDGETKAAILALELSTDLARLPELARQSATSGQLFSDFESELRGRLEALGRQTLSLFLAHAEELVLSQANRWKEANGRRYRVRPAQKRKLLTRFGMLTYERTYLREAVPAGESGRGFHPLDAQLGLFAERISPGVLADAVEMSTRVSYAEAHEVLGKFLPVVPSTEVMQKGVLGYGARAREWLETGPLPTDDGDVLIVQIDSKGVPMATDTELERRRGARQERPTAASPRHRGRHTRADREKKPRRKKGDKAKNAKMGNMVVMYTLRRNEQGQLLGPINKRFYASFGSKRHAFEYARRQAERRGFGASSGRTVQLVTDGDPDLKRFATEYLPQALQTIDVMHVIEKLWEIAAVVHKEGTPECEKWAKTYRSKLYAGETDCIIEELERLFNGTAKTGPGNKYRRHKLERTLLYIRDRRDMMNYKDLREADLEIGSGPVEGAIKYLMAKRMDHGGMRWIKERAEALLQLRCIVANGDWKSFVTSLHDALRSHALGDGPRPRLTRCTPAPLPAVASKAA